MAAYSFLSRFYGHCKAFVSAHLKLAAGYMRPESGPYTPPVWRLAHL